MMVKRDYRIPSLRDGHRLLLRNKRLNDEEQRLSGMIVLFDDVDESLPIFIELSDADPG
jgi:hypothetical protein